jgi:hypothetical protein
MTDGASYTGYVRASDALYPRGGVWLYLGWFAIAAAVLLWADRNSPVFVFIVPCMALAAAALIWIFRTRGGAESFSADRAGLRFWGGATGHRIDIALPWSDIGQLRVSRIPGGSLLQVLLNPGVNVAYRSRARQLADLAFMFFVPVAGVRRNVPAVALARADPPRYQLPLLRVGPAELHAALEALAPGTPIDIAS